MTSEEHYQEIERIVEENAIELIKALENRKPYSPIYKDFIKLQIAKAHRELTENAKKFTNS